jgi:excisionase family DNA binding protein
MNAPVTVAATPDIDARSPDPGSWRADSMCRQHPTDWWFAGGHRDTMLAKRICADCVVQPQCLEFALGRPELLGVWAATTPNERAAMRRAGTTEPPDCRRGMVDLVLEAALDAAGESAPEPDTRAAATAVAEPVGERPSGNVDGPPPMRERLRRHVGAFGDRDALLTPAEAARLLGVTPNTVTRWSRAGKMSAIQTMGGHRRFRRSEVERVLRDSNLPASSPN